MRTRPSSGNRAVRFACGIELIDQAYELAIKDIRANIKPYRAGLLDRQRPVIISGSWYRHPWTRDNAFNTWNCCGLLYPDIARNTLLSVVKKEGAGLRIGGQYWDCIAWATGAWFYYCYTGDRDFLATAFEATTNTLAQLEKKEFDAKTGLFMGQPSYADGVSAYPSTYRIAGHSDGDLENGTVVCEGEKRVTMKALSTNCLYFNACRLAAAMGEALGLPAGRCESFRMAAAALKTNINRYLWLKNRGWYAYFWDANGLDATQESLGHALAILFGIADRAQVDLLFRNQYVSRHGVPCIWPPYPEYVTSDNMTYGRHSGTIWPMQMGFWAMAAAVHRRMDVFAAELFSLATLALRSGNFGEIYHPVTGQPYGGLQVIEEKRLYNPLTGKPYGEFQEINGRRFYLTASKPRTTWSATAYVGMLLHGLLGMRFSPDGISFDPMVPEGFPLVELSGLRYRSMDLSVQISGHGKRVGAFAVNRARQSSPRISSGLKGKVAVVIEMTK